MKLKMRQIEALWLVVLDFRTPLYIYIGQYKYTEAFLLLTLRHETQAEWTHAGSWRWIWTEWSLSAEALTSFELVQWFQEEQRYIINTSSEAHRSWAHDRTHLLPFPAHDKTCLSVHVDSHALILKLSERWHHSLVEIGYNSYICASHFPSHLVMFWLRKLLPNNSNMWILQKTRSMPFYSSNTMLLFWVVYVSMFNSIQQCLKVYCTYMIFYRLIYIYIYCNISIFSGLCDTFINGI